MTEYDEIRKILARWYDGETDSEELRRLSEFFASHRDLPADLAHERELFGAFAVAEEEGEIPEELASRINDAIETEMAKERVRKPFAYKWRRRIIAACVVSACIAVAVMSILTYDESRKDAPKPMLSLSQPVASDSSVTDTASVIMPDKILSPVPAKNMAENKKTNQRSKAKQKRALTDMDAAADDACQVVSHNAGASELARAAEETEQDLFLSEAEEQRLIAANYHVVKDENEANEILNSVFGRLEEYIARSNSQINEIAEQYEMQVSKVSFIP